MTHALLSEDYLSEVASLTTASLARTLRGWASEANTLADQLDPPAPLDGMLPFELIPVGAEVKVAGEWQRVLSKSYDTAFDGSQARRLLLAEKGKSAWWYEMADGEALLLAEPF